MVGCIVIAMRPKNETETNTLTHNEN